MRLYFLRHGEAGSREEWSGPDEERPLTRRGVAEMRAAAHGMRWLDLQVDLVLSSALVRARQTAEIVADAFKQQVTLAQGLASGCSLVELAQTLAEYVPVSQTPNAAENGPPPTGPAGGVVPRGVLLVGHEPDFSVLIGALIGRKGSASIVLKKGALCRVDLDPTADGWRWDTTHLRASGALAWLLTAKQLRQLGR
jgi:phosphohistidine phosphatase